MKSNDHLPTFRRKRQNKKMRRILLCLSPVIALFSLITSVYIASYYFSPQQRPGENTGAEESRGYSNIVIQAGPRMDDQETEEQVVQVDDSTDIYITPRMTYTFEIYDGRTGEIKQEEKPIPNAMYGLNRQELEQYLSVLATMENETLTDVQYHYEVRLFSRRAFTVRRTITEKIPEFAVFLIAENGYLTAYTGDRTQIYEMTQIALADFPLEQQAMLTRGIYMKTLADYYDFLESYSS